MTLYGICQNNSRLNLGKPVSLLFSREADAPAGLLKVSFQVGAALPRLREIEVLNDESRPWFCGLVDEQNTTLGAAGLQVELLCRSLEAILLDNEAPPQTLQRPSLPMLEASLLTPFGLRLGAGDCGQKPGALFVEKGDSCWAVLARFCRNEFGSVPWVDEHGAVQCRKRTPKGFKLRDVTSAELRLLPCKEVREVILQSCRGGYDTYYRSGDFTPGRPGTPRRRYVSAQCGKNPKDVLKSGAEDSFLLTVTCKGAWLPQKGDLASVFLPGLGAYRRCPIRSVQYRLDRSGERTKLVLERPEKEEQHVADKTV